MKLNEKIELFSRLSLADAKGRRDEVRKTLEARLNSAVAQIRADAENRRLTAVDEARRRVQFNRNRESVAASTEVKRSLIELREQLLADLFENVLQRIAAYRDTEDYKAGLIDSINKSASDFPEGLIVTVMEDDLPEVAAAFSGRADIEIAGGAEDMLGGFRALVKGKSITIDNSYKLKIEEAKENFQGFRISECSH